MAQSVIDLSFASVLMVLMAGLASVASPCVLPVVPIIVTGTEDDHRLRPLLLVVGLAISFMTMGALTSLFGGLMAGYMPVVEKLAGGIVVLLGLLMVFDINPFKRLTLFSGLQVRGRGAWSGLLLGLTLGLIWIPCVGPLLSGVLTLVATDGRLSTGLILLAVYSLGFALPMLLLGYASQAVRQRIRRINADGKAVRLISGTLLIAFGVYIATQGMLIPL